VEETDDRHPRLLRARRERPRYRCATEQRDELASFHCPMPSRASERKNSTQLSYGRRPLRTPVRGASAGVNAAPRRISESS